MLEHIVANVLKTFLNEFIELDASGGNIYDKVHVGAWNGDLVLENVVLKKSIFSALGLPISLSYGIVGKLDLRIPWATLGIDPVVVTIDSVYLLLEPKYEWDPQAYNKREQMAKQAKLAAAELFASRRLSKDTALNKYSNLAKKWLFESFLFKAVNNIQVTIREMHIRYEDHVSVDGSPFCFGFTLESLHIGTATTNGTSGSSDNSSSGTSSDNNSSGGNNNSSSNSSQSNSKNEGTSAGSDEDFGMRSFDGADSFRKLVEISHLAFYWNPLHTGHNSTGTATDPCTMSFKNQSRADVERLMSRTICKRYHHSLGRPKHHYILHPTNISVRLDISLDATVGGARGIARCNLSDINIVFEDSQYRKIALLSANMSNFMQLERFSGIRPKRVISEIPDPEPNDDTTFALALRDEKARVVRSWWRYAIQAEVEKLTNPTYQTCTTHHKQRRRIEDQLVYIELWKSKLMGRASALRIRGEPEGRALFAEICALSRRRRAVTKIRKASSESAAEFAAEAAMSLDADDLRRNANNDGPDNAGSSPVFAEPVRSLSDAMASLLSQLEERLSYEQIIYFRSLAENDLSYDDPKSSWMGTWVNWASGGRMDNSKILAALRSDPERIFRGTQFGSPQTRVAETEPSGVLLLTLQKGSITIALSKPQSLDAGTYIPFLEVTLDGCRTTAIMRGNGDEASFTINTTLQSIAAYEILPSAESAGGWRRQCIAERRTGGLSFNGNGKSEVPTAPESPLFSLTFELAPPGKKTLTANLEQLQMLISTQAPWVSQMTAWSSLYPEELVSWQRHQLATINQLENYTAKLAAKLEQMVQQSPSLWISATVNAPVIVLSGKGTPQPPNASTAGVTGGDANELLLILDLGQVRIKTERLAMEDHFLGLRERSIGFTSDATHTTITVDEQTRARRTSISRSTLRRSGSTQILEGDEYEEEDGENEYEGEYEDIEDEDSPDNDLLRDETRGKDDVALRELDDQGFYDVFDVQVSEIEVYLMLLGDWFASTLPEKAEIAATQASPKIGIVDKFDVNMKVYVSVVFYDATISTCQLEVVLPEIHVRLSQEKLLSLMRFAESFRPAIASPLLPANDSVISLVSSEHSAESSGVKSSGVRMHSGWDAGDKFVQYETLEQRWASGRVEEVHELEPGSKLEEEDANNEFFDTAEAGTSSQDDATATSGVEWQDAKSVASDDSFLSVEEDDPGLLLHSQRCETLLSTIRQSEQVVSSLMSQVRIAETVLSGAHVAGAVNTSSEAARLQAVTEDLRVREGELRTLKARYVEARMARDALQQPEGEYGDSARGESQKHIPLPFEAFQDDGGHLNAGNGIYGGQGTDPANRGQLPHTKAAPITKEHGRQWLRAEITLAAVSIEVRCPVVVAPPRDSMKSRAEERRERERYSPSLRTTLLNRADNAMRASSRSAGANESDGESAFLSKSPLRVRESESLIPGDDSREESVVLRLAVGGVRANIKYEEDLRRMNALKVKLDVRTVDIEDALSSASATGNDGTPYRIFLVSTQPSIPWVARALARVSPQFSNDTDSAGPDLLSLRYTFGSSGEVDGTRHKVRLDFRFVEANVVPSTLAVLASMGAKVADAVGNDASTSRGTVKVNNHNTAEQAATVTKPSNSYPCIDLRCRGSGLSLSLCDERDLEKNNRDRRERLPPTPLCTFSLWSWTVRGESRAESMFLDLKLKELAAHHHVEGKIRPGPQFQPNLSPQHDLGRGDWEWGDFSRGLGSSSFRRERRDNNGFGDYSPTGRPMERTLRERWDKESIRIAGRSYRGGAVGSVPCIALHIICSEDPATARPNVEAKVLVAPLKVLLVPSFITALGITAQSAAQKFKSNDGASINPSSAAPSPVMPPAPTPPMSTAPSDPDASLNLPNITGRAEVILGQLDVILPESYAAYELGGSRSNSRANSPSADAASPSTPGASPHQSLGRAFESPTTLTITLGSVSTAVIFSTQPEPSVEFLTTLNGATILLGPGMLVAPFDIHSRMRILPATVEDDRGYYSSLYSRRIGLLGSYRDLPLHAPCSESDSGAADLCPKIADVHLAIALSPVVLSVSELRLAAGGKWASAWGAVSAGLAANDAKTNRLVAAQFESTPSQPPAMGPSAAIPPLASFLPPISARMTLVMQEVAVSLESNIFETGSAPTNIDEGAVGIYLISVRGFAVSLAAASDTSAREGRETSNTSSDNHINSAVAYAAETFHLLEAVENDDGEGSGLVRLAAVCRSVDFDDRLGTLYRRLVCTSNTDAVKKPPPLLTLNSTITSRTFITNLSIQGAQVYVVSDSIVRLVVLIEGYAEALSGMRAGSASVTSASGIHSHANTGLLTLLDVAMHSRTRKATPAGDSAKTSSGGPQPASLPLSSSDTHTGDRAGRSQEAADLDDSNSQPLRVFLTQQALSLPMAFRQFSFAASLLGCGLWIPMPDAASASLPTSKTPRGLSKRNSFTSPRHAQSTNAVALGNPLLHAGADVSMSSSHCAIDWDELLPTYPGNSFVAESAAADLQAPGAQAVLTTRVALTSISVNLSRNVHPLAHQPLLPISQFDDSDPFDFIPPVNDGFQSTPRSSKGEGSKASGSDDASVERVLLVPFSAELSHRIEVAGGGIVRKFPDVVVESSMAPPKLAGNELADSETATQAASLFAFRRMSIGQRLSILVQEVQLLVFLDSRTLLALADGLGSLASLGGSIDAASASAPLTTPAPAMPSDVTANSQISIFPSSLLELLPHIGAIGPFYADLYLEGVSVHVVNDLYHPPVCVARLLCGSVMGSASGSLGLGGPPESEYCPYPFVSITDGISDASQSGPADSDGISCSIKTTAGVDYRNQTLSVWEPVLEPVEAHLNYRFSSGPAKVPTMAIWCLEDGLGHVEGSGTANAKMNLSNIFQTAAILPTDSSADVAAPVSCNELSVSMPTNLNINLTLPLLETIHSVWSAVNTLGGPDLQSTDIPTGDATSQREGKGRNRGDVRVQNNTGLPLFYAAKVDADARMRETLVLAPDCEAPLSFEVHGGMGIGRGIEAAQRVGDWMHSSRIVRLAVCSAKGAGDAKNNVAVLALPSDPDEPSPSETVDVSLEGRGCRILTMTCNKEGDASDSLYSIARSATIVTELYSRAGMTSLLVRSTARVANQTTLPVKLLLLAGNTGTWSGMRQGLKGAPSYLRREPLFEALIAPGASVSLPAVFCDLRDNRLVFLPVTPGALSSPSRNDVSFITAEIPLPGLPGGVSSPPYEDDDEENTKESQTSDARLLSKNNKVRRCVLLQQERGTVDTLSFSHWLHFATTLPNDRGSFSFPSLPNLPADSANNLNCNVHVVSKGAPRSFSSRTGAAIINDRGSNHYLPPSSSGGTDTCMSRVITLSAPVTIQNLLAVPVYVALISEALMEHWAEGFAMKGVQTGGWSDTGMGAIACAFTISLPVNGGEESVLESDGLEEQSELPAKLSSGKSAAVGSIYIARLAPGESFASLFFHSTETFAVALRMEEEDAFELGQGGSERMNWGSRAAVFDVSTLGAGQGRDDSLWSSAAVVPMKRGKKSRTLEALIRYPNASTLRVQVEVADKSGGRALALFVPYWIVSQSVLPLEFAHNYFRGTPRGAILNGLDGLCADQEYRYKYEDHSNTSTSASKSDEGTRRASTEKNRSGFGIGLGLAGPGLNSTGPRPARGGSVLLGPERAVRGLGDLLDAGRSSIGGLGTSFGTAASAGVGLGFLSRQALCRRRTASGGDDGASDELFSEDRDEAPRYSLVQCGYSNTDRRTAAMQVRIRGRMGDTPGTSEEKRAWSTPFFLDALASEAELRRTSRGGVGAETVRPFGIGSDSESGPEGEQTFVFGISSTLAVAPFGRTKICVVVDRYILVNALGPGNGGGRSRILEVRQYGYEQELFSVRSGDSTPMCWRPLREKIGSLKSGSRGTIQIRLAQPGWAWSGRVELGSNSSETTLRLRNDQDKSVFFLCLQVVVQGPRVCVIFRGGSQFAPYRIENHTLDTLQVLQSSKAKSIGTRDGPVSTPLSLLPYHVASYAWDEPLQPHFLRLQVLASNSSLSGGGNIAGIKGVSGHSMRGDTAGNGIGAYNPFNRRRAWRDVGVFGFDRLCTWDSNSTEGGVNVLSLGYLVIRVLASGGQRVLQILDRRNLPSVSRNPSLGNQATPSNKNIPALALRLRIESVGVSLVDHLPQELLFLSIRGITIWHGSSSVDSDSAAAVDAALNAVSSASRLILSVDHVQLDSQLWSTPYPSILYPLRRGAGPVSLDGLASSTPGSAEEQGPFVSMTLEYDVQEGMVLLPILRVGVLPFDVNVEAGIVTRVVNAVTHFSNAIIGQEAGDDAQAHGLRLGITDSFASFSKERESEVKLHEINSALHVVARESGLGRRQADGNFLDAGGVNINQAPGTPNGHTQGHTVQAQSAVRDLVQSILLDIAAPLSSSSSARQSELYIEILDISDIRFNLSLNLDVKQGGENLLAQKMQSANVMLKALTTILLAAVSSLVKVDNCQMRFSGYRRTDVFCSQEELEKAVQQHYVPQALAAAGLLLFSVDVLGNPVEMVRTLGEGLKDFLVLPAMGLMAYDPAAFGEGLVMGTKSLLCRTAASLLTSLCHFTVSLQIGLSTLGVVDPFLGLPPPDAKLRGLQLVQRNNQRGYTGRPVGLVDGFMIALQDLLTSPYIGFKTGGLGGLAAGIFYAIAGLAAKPVYGLLTDASTRLNDMSFKLLPRVLGEHKYRLRRSRPPRFFAPGAPNQPLSVYSEDENIGSELLSRVALGQYSAESYVWYAPLHDQCIVIITSARVIVVGGGDNSDDGFCEMLWQCPLKKLLFLEIDETAAAGGGGGSNEHSESERLHRTLPSASGGGGSGGLDARAALAPVGGPSLRLLDVRKTGSPLRQSALGEDAGAAGGGIGRARSNSAPAPLASPLRTPQRGTPSTPQSPSSAAPPQRRAAVLRLYYLPQPEAKAGSAARPCLGLALNQWSLNLLTQEALLLLLVRLLCLVPGLASEQVVDYLRSRGVRADFKGSNSAAGGSHGHRRVDGRGPTLALTMPRSPQASVLSSPSH